MKLKFVFALGIFAIIGCVTNEQDNDENQNDNELVGPIETNSDNLKEHFTADISNYLEAFNHRNWDGVVDMVYPKMFDLIPKDQMKQSFNQLEEMGMDMKTEFKEITKISEVIIHENSKFCRVYYHSGITIIISGLMLENKEQLIENFITAYGSDNVNYYENENRFFINAIKSMIAVLNEDSDDWKYIEYNDQQKVFLGQFIPSKVLEQIEN